MADEKWLFSIFLQQAKIEFSLLTAKARFHRISGHMTRNEKVFRVSLRGCVDQLNNKLLSDEQSKIKTIRENCIAIGILRGKMAV